MSHALRMRLLRAAIGLVLISFVATLVWLLARREPAPPVAPMPTELLPEEEGEREVSHVALDFDVTRTHEGRADFRLRADRVLGLEGNIYQLEAPVLQVHHEDGTSTRVTGREGAFDIESEEGRIEGEARAEGARGVVVESDALHYRQGGQMLEADGDARFARPGLRGRGEGLRYDPVAGRLSLDRNVRVDGEGDSSGPAWTLHAAWLEHFPADDTLRTGPFRLDTPTGTLTGRILDLELEKEGGRVRRMTATGDAVLHRAPESEDAGPVDLGGDRIVVEPSAEPSGEPRRVEALGRAVLTSRPPGQGEREITADHIEIRRAEPAGRELEAVGSVRLRDEAEDGTTLMAATWLLAGLGADGEMTDGRAEGGVEVSGPRGVLRGERATFDRGSDVIETHGIPGRPSVLEDGDGRVTAARIRVDRPGRILIAEEDVRTVSRARGARSGALFEAGQPVHGTADRLTAHQGEDRAIYEGAVRLWQGENLLQADRAEILREQGEVHADGRVVTRSVRPSPEGGAPRLVRGTSEHFEFYEAQGLAVYETNALLDWATQRVEAHRVEVTLDDEREVQRVDARGEVHLFGEGLRAVGERLDYDVPAERAILYGGDALAEAEDLKNQRLVRGRSLTFDLADATIAVESAPGGRTWITLPGGEEPSPPEHGARAATGEDGEGMDVP